MCFGVYSTDPVWKREIREIEIVLGAQQASSLAEVNDSSEVEKLKL